MKTNSPFILLTLSNGNKPVIIPKDNIAFAMETAGENAEGKTVSFTRVFLKAVMIDDEAKWVDVRETPKEISLRK